MPIIWKILFIGTAAQGTFLTFASLLAPKFSRERNRWLVALLAAFTMTISYYLAFWLGLTQNLPFITQAPLLLVLTFGPLLYFFLLKPNPDHKTLILHFSPLAIAATLFLLQGLSSLSILGYSRIIIELLQLTCYAVLLITKTTRERKWLAFSFTGYATAYICYYLLVWTNNLDAQSDYVISLAMSLCIYGIAYWSFVKNVDQNNLDEKKYEHSSLTDNTINFILQKADRLMVNDQIFLLNDLKMKKLADLIGISSHDLSQAINKGRKTNFNDYVNEWRVNHSIDLMKNDQKGNESLLGIAVASGFNNKTSYLNAFKKLKGQSPSYYRQQLLAQAS